jgi:hypothetical protein
MDVDVDIDVVTDADATPCAALQDHRALSICTPLPRRGEGLLRERFIAEEGTAPAILDGDALAAKLDEARASHNGTHVVAVAVHLDPEGRCCGADHVSSVA